MSEPDPLEYCRNIESYLCQKNEGHLIRVVGPSFEVVASWMRDHIPFKVACVGIDRSVERYYRKGPRRRPVRIEFCDADVRDAFDEWRRATGMTGSGATTSTAPADVKAGPSLPEHLERALMRFTNARATGRVDASFDPLIDEVSVALDEARAASGGLRGQKRQALLERLEALDARVSHSAVAAIGAERREELTREVEDELSGFRQDMPADRFASVSATALDRKIRAHLGLPVLRFA